MNVIFSGLIDGLRTLKDRSLKLSIETQEPDNEAVAKLVGLNGSFVKILISDKNIIPEQTEALEAFKVEEDAGKSPAQRLRAVLYVNWQKNPKGYEVFEDYYRAKMETIIVHFKGKLD
jgi:hypothetical protein